MKMDIPVLMNRLIGTLFFVLLHHCSNVTACGNETHPTFSGCATGMHTFSDVAFVNLVPGETKPACTCELSTSGNAVVRMLIQSQNFGSACSSDLSFDTECDRIRRLECSSAGSVYHDIMFEDGFTRSKTLTFTPQGDDVCISIIVVKDYDGNTEFTITCGDNSVPTTIQSNSANTTTPPPIGQPTAMTTSASSSGTTSSGDVEATTSGASSPVTGSSSTQLSDRITDVMTATTTGYAGTTMDIMTATTTGYAGTMDYSSAGTTMDYSSGPENDTSADCNSTASDGYNITSDLFTCDNSSATLLTNQQGVSMTSVVVGMIQCIPILVNSLTKWGSFYLACLLLFRYI